MNLGFIGTGKIASSIIFGIFKSNLKINRIYISSRNRNIAKKLKGRFSRIKICSNNQEIIDKASVIFLSVTPPVGNKILNNLSFKGKTVISLISTIKERELKSKIHSKNICKAIPLPFVENRVGPIIICPKNRIAKKIFSKLGLVIEVNKEQLSFNFWATSSFMASYYEIYNSMTKWLIRRGLKKSQATNYVAELFFALSKDALLKKNIGFGKLVSESQTPKGLNMQVLKELKKAKFYEKINKSLNNVYKKFKK